MTVNLQQQLNHIVETRSRATRLDTLIQGYKLCARSEGKSENTIRIANTALTTLKSFLESRECPTEVAEIGVNELREFMLGHGLEGSPKIDPKRGSGYCGGLAAGV
jgi:hypothetical protein